MLSAVRTIGAGHLRRQPGYAPLLAAATVARLANEMFPVAVVLYVLERTGSEGLAGATVAALTLPSLVTGPLLGAASDRSLNRVRWLALDQAVGAASLAAVTAVLEGGGPEWAVPALVLAAGLTFPLSTGGFTALIPAVVPASLLGRANALEASSFNLAMVGGPALAATVALGWGTLTAVLVQLGLKLLALATCLVLPVSGGGSQSEDRSLAEVLAGGFRHVLSSRPLLAITTAGALGMAGRGLLTLAFPLFAAEALGETQEAAGYLWSALAAGAVAGALGFAYLRLPDDDERVVLAALAVAGALMLSWPLANTLAPALALVCVTGVALGPGLTATFGVRQRLTPASLHGHVFMTAASLKVAAFGAGAALAGPAVVQLGAEGTLVLTGALQLVAAGCGRALLRRGAAIR